MKKQLLCILSILLTFSLMACTVEAPKVEEEKVTVKQPTIKEESAEKKIGRIITYADFLEQLPKRVNLDNYTLESTKYETISSYTYTSNCEIRKSKRNFEVTIDGIKVTMPSTVQELLGLGFEAVSQNHTDGSVDLSSYARTVSLEMRTPKGNTFSVYAASKDNSLTPLNNLIVMQISCDFYDGNITYGVGERSDAPEIKFFKNVDNKATVDSILKELKRPQYIHFSEVTYRDKTTLSTMQLNFMFSNEDYDGSLTVTLEAVHDESIERTSYVLSFSYLIDYDSIKSS